MARMGTTLLPDADVLAAIGSVAVRHGQLDYCLRMTVKTLARVNFRDGLDGTARQTSFGLRDRIKKLARKHIGEGPALVKLDAILTRARQATEKRNELLHAFWCQILNGEQGMYIDQAFEPIPTIEKLNALATELEGIANELNTARMKGFLHEALQLRG
jgi:hypothetical protein